MDVQLKANVEKQENADEFAEQILKARHRLGQDGVNRPILDVLRNEPGRGDDRQDRGENRDGAQRYVFQDLKLLLKAEARHKDRTTDQDECKDQHEIENALTRKSVSVLEIRAKIRPNENLCQDGST